MTEQKRNIISVLAALALFAMMTNPLFLTMLDSGDATVSGPTAIDRMANPANVEAAKKYFADVAARNFDPIVKLAEPECASPDLPAQLAKMADYFPKETPQDVKTVGYHYFNMTSTAGSAETSMVTLEYRFPSAWVAAEMTLRRKDGADARIVGLRVARQPDSVENLSRFRLGGQDAVHYAVLAFALAEAAFGALVLALCIRTPIPRRKWLWVLFVMMGVCQFNFNWLTEVLNVNPPMIYFPIVQFSKNIYEPLNVMFSIPLGGLIFLAKRRKWMSAAAVPPAPPPGDVAL